MRRGGGKQVSLGYWDPTAEEEEALAAHCRSLLFGG